MRGGYEPSYAKNNVPRSSYNIRSTAIPLPCQSSDREASPSCEDVPFDNNDQGDAGPQSYNSPQRNCVHFKGTLLKANTHAGGAYAEEGHREAAFLGRLSPTGACPPWLLPS